jgi:hypothetical protein
MSNFKNIFLCLFIYVTAISNVLGQQRFLKKYDLNKVYNHAVAIKQLPDSSYWVLNKRHINSDPESDLDASMMHIDKSGNVLKSIDFGWQKSNFAEDFIIDGDKLVVVGSGYSTGKNKIFLYKINFNGDKINFETYGGESKNSACKIIKQNEAYYIVGDSYNVNNDIDFFLVKTTLDGALIWQKWYGDSHDEFVFSGAGTKDGGIAIAGAKWNVSKQGYRDMHVKKINANGNLEWESSFHDTIKDALYNETISDILQTKDGGYFITARQFNEFSQNRPIIAKLNSNGKLEWYKTLFSSIKPNSGGHFQKLIFEKSGLNSSTQLENGNILSAGYARSSTNAEESGLLITKFTPDGEIMWLRNYRSGECSETGYNIISTLDKGLIVCGRSIYTNDSDHMPDAILLKTDSIGCYDNKCNDGKFNIGIKLQSNSTEYFKDDTIIASITASNYGINNANNVSISTSFSRDLQYINADASKGSYNGRTWSLGSLKANEKAYLNIKFKASRSIAASFYGSITNNKNDIDNANDTARINIIVKQPYLDENTSAIKLLKIASNQDNAYTVIEYKLPVDATATIKIIDLTGRVISEKTITGKSPSITIANQYLPLGICFYELWYNNKLRDSKKFANIK